MDSYYNQIICLDEKRALVVKKFFEDMEINLRAVYEQLEDRGKYIIVIGNSTIREVDVESWKVIEQIANTVGYNTVQYFNYIIQNPYIRIPRKGMGGKISRDYVLVLEKEFRYGAEKQNQRDMADSEESQPASDDLSD